MQSLSEQTCVEGQVAESAAPPVRKWKMNKRKRNEYIWGWIFISPLSIGFLLFTAFPLVLSVYYSFTQFDLFSLPQWV